MRFECDNCKAKYKISDEKVRGRVVRFPCRKCKHKILIDGRQQDADVTVPAGAAYGFDDVTRRSEPISSFSQEAATAKARRPSSPVRRRPPSVPPRRPSAASRRLSSIPPAPNTGAPAQHPGLTPPVPLAGSNAAIDQTLDLPEWHVSINDVPVGPIRLEEMGHKIDAGAVSEYSLVWRDGFEEWRPLATVPELMAVLHQHRQAGLPARTSFSSMPPFVDSRTSTPDSGEIAVPPPPTFPSDAGDFPLGLEPLADSLQPEGGMPPELREMSQPPAPIGPDDVFESSPQLGSYSGLPPVPDERVSVPSVPPEPVAATAEPQSRLSLGGLILILAVLAFSGVVAFLAFERYGDSLLETWLGRGEPAAIVAPAPKPAPVPAVAAETTVSEELASEELAGAEGADAAAAVSGDLEQAGEPGELEEGEAGASASDTEGAEEASETALAVPPPDPKDTTPKMAPARKPRARRAPRPKPAATAPPAAENDGVSDADQKLLDEYGSAGAAPAKIDVKKSGSTQSKKPALDSAAVVSTVNANKPRLQRCYERAVRGMQSPPAVRLDVSVTVAASGRVRDVSSQGSGPGGLAECVEASVRRWRFPQSSEGGPARFPIVFSAN